VRDEVRPQSRGALKEARGAGIQVIMITGDRMETAMAVAREIALDMPDSINLTSDDMQARAAVSLRHLRVLTSLFLSRCAGALG
jgi:magnesium-transporting ATPase (P-type)